MANQDKVFDKLISKQFEFDNEVASVFDDMLNRSIPYYDVMLDLTVLFALKYTSSTNDTIYDFGCSTASTLVKIAQKSSATLDLIGIDSSKAMLEQASNKIKAYGLDIKLVQNDIFDITLKKSKVIIANYTLQFVRPLQREKLIKKFYDSLEDGGILIFSEKTITQDKILHKHLIDIYYDFKKTKGYSDFEISQKREALENVLIPYSYDENHKMIKDAGFKTFESIFKWINFGTFIAIK